MTFSISSLDCVSGWYGSLGMIPGLIWKRSCINLYVKYQIYFLEKFQYFNAISMYMYIISHNISKPVNKLNQSNTNTSLFQTIKLSKGQVWFIHISLHSLQLVFYIKDFEDRNMIKTTMIGVLQKHDKDCNDWSFTETW